MSKDYNCCTEEGRNRTLKFQFTKHLLGEPQSGDVIMYGGERWTCVGRLWEENGNFLVLVRKPGGLVHV